jgi:hypothetical protein
MVTAKTGSTDKQAEQTTRRQGAATLPTYILVKRLFSDCHWSGMPGRSNTTQTLISPGTRAKVNWFTVTPPNELGAMPLVLPQVVSFTSVGILNVGVEEESVT